MALNHKKLKVLFPDDTTNRDKDEEGLGLVKENGSSDEDNGTTTTDSLLLDVTPLAKELQCKVETIKCGSDTCVITTCCDLDWNCGEVSIAFFLIVKPS